jgi:hypothetical protein
VPKSKQPSQPPRGRLVHSDLPPESERVLLPGTDIYVNRRHTIERTNDPGLDVDFVATFELDEERYELELAELIVRRRPGGPPVTSTSLRELNMTTTANFALTAWRRSGRGWQPVDWQPDKGEDEMDYVVRVYRMAAATRMKKTEAAKAIAAGLGLQVSSANSKIWLARKMGLLEPARRTMGND